MKIKLIDFGLEKDHYPFRPHENDAGADVYMPYDYTLKPGEIARIPNTPQRYPCRATGYHSGSNRRLCSGSRRSKRYRGFWKYRGIKIIKPEVPNNL